MPYLHTNGVRLAYQRSGRGETVLFVMGSGASGYVWDMHQTPALHRAGYSTVTFDNRGIPPSEAPPGKYALADLVADTKGLIETLDLAPCRIVGTSMGSLIAQELAISEPQLVRSAVLMATRGRSDVLRRAQSTADRVLQESGIKLPAKYRAVNSVLHMLSPATLNDDASVASWLEIFELAGDAEPVAAGQEWIDTDQDRREDLSRITAPCRVIAFTDDVVTPPHLGAEVADLIPDCDLVEISRCGHLGHLERPEPVNEAIVEFFDKH
ncbi:alpha/beta fold hydrolase [Streptomyces sp. NL15-2K]|uniref:alpha/beta fold hydrolase n=1 Tax=Streptomyces sp. NL15-2K TaxID=376149 RepID=UPI000F569AEB|nr:MULTISPECIES: alpha/beta fold hydrolase [Actinomycetes]WKX06859.1 alpha/beta fold hydrolase [Kutzneria buriramensis]GCB43877.1 beta-ketoadipate enol-lactone hydrolase [Streptomyces sp. NL15-2K]